MTTPLHKSPAQGHIPALDGIRGLAILGVVCVHFFMSYTPQNILELAIQKISGFGTLGIDLFFMLSGFLITGILLETKSKSHYFRNFLLRRFLRIFPLYYLVLALVLLALILIPGSDQPPYSKIWEAQPWAWSYLFNFFIAREGSWSVPYMGHFWSLAVEEQFYLVWPFVVYRLSAPRLMQLSIGIIIATTTLLAWMEVSGFSKVTLHVLTPLRLNALCIGAWLATWLRQPRVLAAGLAPIRRRALQVFILAVLTKVLIIILVKMVPHLSEAMEALRTLSWLGLFAAMHLSAVSLPPSSLLIRGLCIQPLTFLGKYSYGIYIFHHFISWPADRYRMTEWWLERLGHQTLAILVNGALGITASILIAWVSYHCFEKHFLRWKNKLAPRP
ncbi:MAG TPA: acyltransferase [Oligoflexus sp.]|uniref:acyltransferase family protein n=1 Tax=Oligoflexus sp. TaxID=1971216 RepID=UPI002D802B46|nr:acyltransferase [Oligoflexus sp.]HET9239980.1 acyltransferase [Oligoflexus sp.]